MGLVSGLKGPESPLRGGKQHVAQQDPHPLERIQAFQRDAEG